MSLARRWSGTLLVAIALAVIADPARAPARGSIAGPRPGAFHVRSAIAGADTLRYSVWLPRGYDPARSWPALVFLHGSGESGRDPEAPTRIGIGPALSTAPERWPFVVVFPQKPSSEEEWWERESLVLAVTDDALASLAIDPERVGLTGMSQGGAGVWMIGARHPDRWSSLVPVCGYGRARTVAGRIGPLAVWAFHGLRDDLVPPFDTRAIVTEIRQRRAAADSSSVRLTLYPEANHNAWDPAYAEPGLPEWLLEQRRVAAGRAGPRDGPAPR